MGLEQYADQLIENKQVVTLMGPTASGKSALAMALAERSEVPVELVSVDSALIYQDMDIGTAKPTADEQQRVAHHLIDIRTPEQSYSAADFVQDVKAAVAEIFQKGHLPILVGGTMMYFNALQKGLSVLPEADASIREKWLEIWEKTPEKLHQRLSEVDPNAAQRIHPNDSQRLVRALEVFEVSGQTLTALQQAGVQPLTEFSLIKFALLPADRSRLHQQIAKRFMQMVEAGLLDEVKTLQAKYPQLHADLPSIRSVGYRQAWAYLAGDYDEETFYHKGIVATRQLAKRQITWLRKEADLNLLDPFAHSMEAQIAHIEQVLSQR